MAICESNAATASTRTRILGLLSLLAGLGWGLAGCASATVGNVNPDTSASDTGQEKKDGGSPNDQNTKNDGPLADASPAACDPFTNSGCSGGKKCTALRQDSSLVMGCGDKGSGAEGDTCTPSFNSTAQTGDDCGEKLACFALSGEPSATCRRICPTSGTANACPANELCSLIIGGLDGLAFCGAATSCLPLKQTGCSSDKDACYFSSTGATCAPKGSVQPGGTCTNANDCEPGSNCLIIGSSGTCSSFCSTVDGNTPSCTGSATGGTICDPLGGGSSEPDLGICRVQP